jgi:hypothetical protein
MPPPGELQTRVLRELGRPRPSSPGRLDQPARPLERSSATDIRATQSPLLVAQFALTRATTSHSREREEPVGFQNSAQGFDQWQSALSRRSCMIVDVSLRLVYLIFLQVLGLVLLRGRTTSARHTDTGCRPGACRHIRVPHRRLQTSRGGRSCQQGDSGQRRAPGSYAGGARRQD